MGADDLARGRRLSSEQKRQAVLDAATVMVNQGAPLVWRRLASRAGCSAKFIHSHPDLKAAVAAKFQEFSVDAARRAEADGRLTQASLHAELNNAEAEIQDLREQLRRAGHRIGELDGIARTDEGGVDLRARAEE